MDRLSKITPEQVEKWLLITDSMSVSDGLREALREDVRNRQGRHVADASGVSHSLVYGYASGEQDGIYLHNAEAILKAWGLRLEVRPI